jgi:hypothetical protein
MVKNEKGKENYLYIFFYIFLIFVIFCIFSIFYAYNSGSCKINKKYPCNDQFCLHKEFKIFLSQSIKNEINKMMHNTEIQKRVTIKTYPETIFNCALPNKSGVTISTQNVSKYAPNLIDYYKNDLCKKISNEIGLNLFPNDIAFPTTCAILIYEKEGDWINWHYDYNYYNGRFFTVLIPITNDYTCTEFQIKDKNDNIKSVNLINNNSICFEGNFLYHRASKLCNNQKRVVLSCQYVTDNNMSFINKLRIKLKDFAYTGKFNG